MNKITISALVVLVLFAILFLIEIVKPPTQLTACTEETLLCPDGSFVGRTGPNCAFENCPSINYIIGVLKQDSKGLKLIFDSPLKSGQSVSYSLPLDIKISNSLKDLVNREVKVLGSFSEGNRLSVYTIEEIGDPSIGLIRFSETKYINGIRITLNKIIQDSRCPKDVNCIQAGSTTVNVTLQSDTNKNNLNISSVGGSIKFDSFAISIDDVQPIPVSTKTLNSEDYILAFKVVQ